jgi:hypothetical protein
MSANAIVGPLPVANVETQIAPAIQIAANTLANGQVTVVRLFGSLGGPAYDLNIRVGVNGNTTDTVVYSQSSLYSNTFVQNDFSNWANNHPGLGHNLYPGPANPPALKLSGEFYLVAQNVGPTAFLSVVDPNGVLGNTNFVANSNTFNSTVNTFISVTHAVGRAAVLQAGTGNIIGRSNTQLTNTSITFGTIEILQS